MQNIDTLEGESHHTRPIWKFSFLLKHQTQKKHCSFLIVSDPPMKLNVPYPLYNWSNGKQVH